MSTLTDVWHKIKRRANGHDQPISVDVLTGYAEWAKSYPAQAHNPLMEIEEQAMVSLLPAARGKACLDLACGSGRYMRLLGAWQAGPVIGVDYSAAMLAQAQVTDTTFRLARSPFLALPFADCTFDVIVCGLGVGHEKNLGQTIREVARLLRPGGSFIYSDFHPFGALAGWQRSFTAANGRIYHLEHYVHLYSHHQRACRRAGLRIEAVLEPRAEAHVPPELKHVPVVLAIKAVKPKPNV